MTWGTNRRRSFPNCAGYDDRLEHLGWPGGGAEDLGAVPFGLEADDAPRRRGVRIRDIRRVLDAYGHEVLSAMRGDAQS